MAVPDAADFRLAIGIGPLELRKPGNVYRHGEDIGIARVRYS